MVLYALPIAYTLFVWWFSTGAILYLDRLPRQTFGWSMAGATLLMAAAVCNLGSSAADPSITGAYTGFSCGLMIWAWVEVGYYMGFMIGPRRDALPAARSGWERFVQAAQTTLYHEIIAVVLGVMIAALTWDMPNRIALWTFVILWSMQLSAKLNVFLGVPNLAESFLPDHLAFLRHYMTRKPMNPFFPVSITVTVGLATLLVAAAVADHATPFDAVGLTILSTLLILAIAEHWLLVVPLPVEKLWRWSLAVRQGAEALRTRKATEGDAAPTRVLRRLLVGPMAAKAEAIRTETPILSRRPL